MRRRTRPTGQRWLHLWYDAEVTDLSYAGIVADQSRPMRRFPRYPVDVPVKISAMRQHGTAFLRGRTRDLGEGGLGAAIDGELAPGESVRLRVRFPDCSLTLQPTATVRYRKGSMLGFEFINLSPLQQAELRSCCRRLAALSR